MTFRNSPGQIYTNLSSINSNICKFLDGLSLEAGHLGPMFLVVRLHWMPSDVTLDGSVFHLVVNGWLMSDTAVGFY